MTTFKAIDLIPHRPPVLLVDEFTFDAAESFASTVVQDAWPATNSLGELSCGGFFELVAQSFACNCAAAAKLGALDATGHTGIGFLVAVKRFKIHGSAKVGDALRMTTQNHQHIGPFVVLDGKVHSAAGELLAEGQLKIFLQVEGANAG